MYAVRKIDANVAIIVLTDEFIDIGRAEIGTWRLAVPRDTLGKAAGRIDDLDM